MMQDDRPNRRAAHQQMLDRRDVRYAESDRDIDAVLRGGLRDGPERGERRWSGRGFEDYFQAIEPVASHSGEVAVPKLALRHT